MCCVSPCEHMSSDFFALCTHSYRDTSVLSGSKPIRRGQRSRQRCGLVFKSCPKSGSPAHVNHYLRPTCCTQHTKHASDAICNWDNRCASALKCCLVIVNELAPGSYLAREVLMLVMRTLDCGLLQLCITCESCHPRLNCSL